MKKFLLTLAATASTIAMAPAANAAITISYSVNGGAQTVLATDAATPGSVSFAGVAGGYTFNVGALGTPATASVYDLLTQSINLSSANNTAATLNVFITETGLPTITNGTLTSAFTTNTQTNNTSVISSFINNTTLQTKAFPTIGTFTGSNVVSAAGPFSLTTRYDITFGAGSGNFNGTANLTAVPEPATWALMMLGFGAIGGMLRTRRSSARIRFA